MKRSGPIQRRTRLRRKTRLQARGRSRFPKRRDPAYCAWVRTLPCVVWTRWHGSLEQRWYESAPDWPLTCHGPIECAHLRSRGAGGGDRGNTFPACRKHHRRQHDKGIETFQEEFHLILPAIARRVWADYCAANPEEAA